MSIVKLLETRGGDFLLPLTDELAKELKWDHTTELDYEYAPDGGLWIFVKPKVKTEFVVVNAIQSFSTRYIVEVPIGHREDAIEAVRHQTDNFKEFSQKYLGENITTTHVIDKNDIVPLCNVENDYCSTWSHEQKFANFVNLIGEKE